MMTTTSPSSAPTRWRNTTKGRTTLIVVALVLCWQAFSISQGGEGITSARNFNYGLLAVLLVGAGLVSYAPLRSIGEGLLFGAVASWVINFALVIVVLAGMFLFG